MAKRKRLLYKDLDSLRFLAFIPFFLYCAFLLMSQEKNEFIVDSSVGFDYLRQNSLDFFFFLSSFLLTSHALREYKYNNSFSLKAFFARRLLRILPIFVILVLFAIFIHPWIIETLKLTDINVPKGSSTRYFLPSNYNLLTPEQYIYIIALWTIIMFMMYYVVWGFILKFFSKQIQYIGWFFVVLGIASRAYHVLIEHPIEFDVLAMATPVGIGAIVANVVRNDQRKVDMIKHAPKANHWMVYIAGFLVMMGGYLFFGNTYLITIIPLLTCSFFGYVIIEQTFGKNSIYKFRSNKLMSRLGKISYGLINYAPIIMVLIVISIESLDFSLASIAIQIAFIVGSFGLSWLIADVSYNFYELPLHAVKKDFKKT